MAIELERIRPLASYQECVICGGIEDKNLPSLVLTKDHIIPKHICDIHSRAFGNIRDTMDNQVRIHWWEHTRIDRYKRQFLRERGLPGLVDAVASYPRSQDPEVLEQQYDQFLRLFNEVYSGLVKVNGKTPRNLLAEYGMAIDKTGAYIYTWSRGDFISFEPILDLSVRKS